MDLVGPLERSAQGHRSIFVILDYATQYPKANPVRNPTSKEQRYDVVEKECLAVRISMVHL